MIADQLKQILPSASDTAISVFLPHLNTYMPQYNINTPQRIGAFLANVGVESWDLKYTTELASGAEYEGNKGLGNDYPGDGARFKGRGLLQITGRDVYKACSLALFKDLRLEANPAIVATPQYAVQSACWFWNDYKHINPTCDNPEDWIKNGLHGYNKFQWICVLVNGGLNDYAARLLNYERARKVLNF